MTVPHSRRAPETPGHSVDPFDAHLGGPGGSLRREIGEVLRSRRLIAAILTLSLLGAALYNYGTRPLYEATAVVSLEPAPDSIVVGRSSALDTMRIAQATDLQLRRLKSHDLALATLRDTPAELGADLAKGEIGGGADRLVGESRHILGLDRPAGATVEERVKIFRSRLRAQSTPPEKAVYVRFTAYDRNAAILAVNRLVDAYVEETRREAQGALGERQEKLAETVAERQSEVVETLDKLQDLEEKQGVQNAQTRRAMLESELVRLQDALTQARQTRQQRRALFEESQRLSTDDVVTLPAFRDDTEITDASTKIVDLESRLTRAAATYGDRHPELVALRADLEQARRRLSLRVIAMRAAIERDYRLAQREEGDISASIATAQQSLARLGRTAVEQSFVQKQADAGQKVVGELIERSVRERDAQILFAPVVVQRGESPMEPVSPRRARNFQYALALGLILGLSIAWLRAHLDETVKTPEDLETQIGLPLLGMVPLVPEATFKPADLFAPEKITSSRLFEAYRVLRTNLTHTDKAPRASRFILVTSSREAEGKTTTSCGIATSLALDGHRVLLIDCDLRRGTLSNLLRGRGRPGLTDALSGRPLDRCVARTPVKGLDLLPSGARNPNPAEVLGRAALVDMVASLRGYYDWIVCDAPPVLAVADAAILCRVADYAVVVVGANLTPVGALRATLRQLDAVHATVRGVILNRVDLDRDSHYYKYYYAGHYADYSGETGAAKTPARRA